MRFLAAAAEVFVTGLRRLATMTEALADALPDLVMIDADLCLLAPAATLRARPGERERLAAAAVATAAVLGVFLAAPLADRR